MGRFAVVGATSWGVTLAWLIAKNGHSVCLITRSDVEAEEVNERRGLARLPGVQLPMGVMALAPAEAPRAVDGVVVATPAQGVRASMTPLAAWTGMPVLSAAKGIEHVTDLRMSEVLAQLGWEPGLIASLAGPNLAHEIARGLPAAAVVGSASTEVGQMWQATLSGGAFRVYHTDDVIGVELGGALKNVIAIAAGAAFGLGLGANTVAAILTRGLAEMTRLGVALGARSSTFQGLAGVGDLAATCYSPLSRNRRLGESLATGELVAAALSAIGETVEGAETAPVALELARRLGVDAPITEQVCAVLEGRGSVAAAMAELLARKPGAEFPEWR